ncbi:Two component system sensor histidine kinase [Desulfonema limicola]|uniref:histidine kinase n=1 Tax=Desulfonema limicola TaxID=45656 RepID=A0A975B3N8_9BACT|nr:response regulator [Desulfonema limicola]QTA78212.1 Two component system sensor histidine kinase [Desulfonema limicola]
MYTNFDTVRVLIVDDERDIREGSQRIISRMDCHVTTASCGAEALEILEKESFSIMLLDLKMPGIDGMEVLRQVKAKNEKILVIIITGFATVETAIEAMKKGAYDFIPKPFEPDHLRIVVNRAKDKLRLRWRAETMARERERTLSDLHTEKSRVRTIVESLPNGVVVTDRKGKVSLMNPAFLHHLDLASDTELGSHISDYVNDKKFCDFIMEMSQGKHLESDQIPAYEISLPNGKYLLARSRPIMGDNPEDCLGAVVNFVDITAMKEIDKVKSEFVAKVSHELRSPLSTIHEQLAMVIKEMVDETSHVDQHLLSRAKEKTQGLIALIGDLLDLSRIEAGANFQEPQPVNIGELLNNIVDFMQARASSRKQSLTIETSDSQIPLFTADPVALESIFGNLIANAINYTPENGTIKVRLDKQNNNICIDVKDTGFGIESKYLDKIFERFYRVKNENTRFITGTGLGLPIVKSLVDELGGKIEVQSEPGKGTCFKVLLPCSS